MTTTIRKQASEDAETRSATGTSLVLTSHELSKLVQIREVLTERPHHHRPVNLSELCDLIVLTGYPFVTGNETPYRYSHYAEPTISQPEIKQFGLTVAPKRRTVAVKKILELTPNQLSQFIELATNWLKTTNQELAQFTISLQMTDEIYSCLREVHYRNEDHGSRHFNSPGRALRVILRDYGDAVIHQLSSTNTDKTIYSILQAAVDQLCNEPKLPVAHWDIFKLQDQMKEIRPEEAKDLLSRLVMGMRQQIILKRPFIKERPNPKERLNFESKCQAIHFLANCCIMQVDNILEASSVVDAKLLELENEKLSHLDQLRSHLLHFTSLIPETWIKRHIAALSATQKEEVRRKIKQKTHYLEIFEDHLLL